MGKAIKHPVSGQVKPSFVNFWHLATLTVRPGCQKITDDGLNQSGTGCFIAVTVGIEGLTATTHVVTWRVNTHTELNSRHRRRCLLRNELSAAPLCLPISSRGPNDRQTPDDRHINNTASTTDLYNNCWVALLGKVQPYVWNVRYFSQ